ncbi:uncharacterized protein LY89DRAFT_747243 [Mollisia scopiformis]|uniref:Uncharacterized protein n=1 Tax=Mollisia scopiformis TaxID=149040 RepID=A0A194XBN7_MOLSC|nr:uncharacterized protein LY89DRAFT_747243 [Mollisia scopiformis]KUJ17576.1 hypothetical protein LY89DRAFT_747243 [Mollisia scopiformis]
MSSKNPSTEAHILPDPSSEHHSQSWRITSGLAYTHSRALLIAYKSQPTALILYGPYPKIAIHGLGTVKITVLKSSLSPDEHVITLRNVLHWPDAPTNAFNPLLRKRNEGLGDLYEVSPDGAKGWVGDEQVWYARKDEGGALRLVVSGGYAGGDGVRGVYATEDEESVLGITEKVPWKSDVVTPEMMEEEKRKEEQKKKNEKEEECS